MSKMIDNNGKLFGKINLLDLTVLVILLVALIGGCYKLFFVDNSVYTPDYQSGTITLRLTNLNDRQIQAIKTGDLLRVPKIQELGTIKHIEVAHRVDNVNSADGKIYSIENPLSYELTVTLETDKLFTRDDFVYVGDSYRLNKGMSLDVSNGLVPCKASVLSIDMA